MSADISSAPNRDSTLTHPQSLAPSPAPKKIFKFFSSVLPTVPAKPKIGPKSCIETTQVYYFATIKKDGRFWLPVFG